MGDSQHWAWGDVLFCDPTRAGGVSCRRDGGTCGSNGPLAPRRERPMTNRPLLAIVDDDESVRESLPDLLKLLGYRVETFSSGSAVLASKSVGDTACLILDIAMPGMTGPELRTELKRRGYDIPVVFITAL